MVYVLDQNGRPVMPCTEKRARLLLERGRARVHRLLPFAIRLIDIKAEDCQFQALRLKLDPGSKVTGMALVRETKDNGVVVLNLFDLMHRGRQISEALTSRRSMRRRKRAQLRYRAPRFLNRGKQRDWLAPSLQHRVDTTMAWTLRLQRLAPVSAISTELVRFDMQAMENPEISGVEYQQGTLAGYEVREYLLEKWDRTCAYCDAKDTPLQIEHIEPKARGGSNRVSNLALSCHSCNQKKAALPIAVFLVKDPRRLAKIQAGAKRPLKDAAAVNATRWALVNVLKTTGLAVETASGGRTKFNRSQLGVPKTHALDAACVGQVSGIRDWQIPTLTIKATGRGRYQRTLLNKYGFARAYLTRQKQHFGFQTGDMVRADVPKGKCIGIHTGRVSIKAAGNFTIQTKEGKVADVPHRFCKMIQRADGYGYSMVQFTKGSGV